MTAARRRSDPSKIFARGKNNRLQDGRYHSMVPWNEKDLPIKLQHPSSAMLSSSSSASRQSFGRTSRKCPMSRDLSVGPLLKIPLRLRMSFEAARRHDVTTWWLSAFQIAGYLQLI
jgi:hypothetical protein